MADSPGGLCSLSTEELLSKISEFGIKVNEEEARKFRENDVDGETVDCGLTEAMVAFLFDGSFKKQVKFQQFVRQYKEGETMMTLEPVPVELYCPSTSSAELQCLPSTDASREAAHRRLPIVTVIPMFPKDVQMKLDAKEPCHRVPKLRNKIIRVLYEMMAEYTLYPTNAEYTQVAKALIMKYPFLRDMEGNGYHTWHMSLKRKFKAERAPLVSDSEVKKLKEKFGHTKQSKTTNKSSDVSRRPPSQSLEIGIGEDSTSVEAHAIVLQSEYRKMHPDMTTVKDLMTRTFSWRRREIVEGMPVEEVLNKYPFLKMPAICMEEVDRIHPSTTAFCKRFRDGFASVLPSVLQLAQGKSALAKQYIDARQDALSEDHSGIDLRAGLLLLPSIFREKIEHYITLGERDAATPYPTIQLMDNDWKMLMTSPRPSVVKVDGVDVCQCKGLDEAFITAFNMTENPGSQSVGGLERESNPGDITRVLMGQSPKKGEAVVQEPQSHSLCQKENKAERRAPNRRGRRKQQNKGERCEECTERSTTGSFPFSKVIRRKEDKVLLQWHPCRTCGIKWKNSWEPLSCLGISASEDASGGPHFPPGGGGGGAGAGAGGGP